MNPMNPLGRVTATAAASGRRWPAATLAAALTALGGAAFAQTPPPEPPAAAAFTPEEVGVLQRPREGYDAVGVRAGSFVIDPSLDIEGLFDSNIFATPSNTTSDFITVLTPAVNVQSDWASNALGLRAQGEFREFAAHPTQDVGNFTIAATGRYDVARDVYFLGGGSYELLHEDTGSPNPVTGEFPTEYTVVSANGAFVYMPSRLGFRLDSTIDSYGFDNVPAAGGPVINETARDRIVYALTPRVSYEITPQYNAFVRAVVNRRQYDSTREPDGLDRSSTGSAIEIGTALDLFELINGEIYLGYLEQSYDQTASHPITGADFGANLLWNLTPITSVRLNVARSAEESTLVGSLGYLQTTAKLSVEHELLRNIVLVGSLAYLNADFQSIPGSSNYYEASLGVRYYFNRNMSAGVEYDFRDRSPIESLSDYTRQIIALRFRAQM